MTVFEGSIFMFFWWRLCIFKKFYWSIVDLQCCIGFNCTEKGIYTHRFFLKFFPMQTITEYRAEFHAIYGCCSVTKPCLFFVTPGTAAHEASLSFTISWSWLSLMSIESVMLTNHLILCHLLLLLPSIFPSIRVFSNESVLCIRWPKYWGFSFSISHSNEYLRLISFRTDHAM